MRSWPLSHGRKRKKGGAATFIEKVVAADLPRLGALGVGGEREKIPIWNAKTSKEEKKKSWGEPHPLTTLFLIITALLPEEMRRKKEGNTSSETIEAIE